MEFEVLLESRLAGEFPDRRSGALVFLINQYDHIVNVLSVWGALHGTMQPSLSILDLKRFCPCCAACAAMQETAGVSAVALEREHWLGLCNGRMAQFAELELETTFPSLIKFVRQTDGLSDVRDLEIGAFSRSYYRAAGSVMECRLMPGRTAERWPG